MAIFTRHRAEIAYEISIILMVSKYLQRKLNASVLVSLNSTLVKADK
jgi:hypothetical protein